MRVVQALTNYPAIYEASTAKGQLLIYERCALETVPFDPESIKSYPAQRLWPRSVVSSCNLTPNALEVCHKVMIVGFRSPLSNPLT
jgi:hypothetical protein